MCVCSCLHVWFLILISSLSGLTLSLLLLHVSYHCCDLPKGDECCKHCWRCNMSDIHVFKHSTLILFSNLLISFSSVFYLFCFCFCSVNNFLCIACFSSCSSFCICFSPVIGSQPTGPLLWAVVYFAGHLKVRREATLTAETFGLQDKLRKVIISSPLTLWSILAHGHHRA